MEGLDVRRAALREAERARDEERAQSGQHVGAWELSGTITSWWDLEVAERNQVARGVLHATFVRATDTRGNGSLDVRERVCTSPAPSDIELPRPPARFDWRPFASWRR